MADFRKQAKANPMKPTPVHIPQLDPLADIVQPSTKKLETPQPVTPSAHPIEQVQESVQAPEQPKQSAPYITVVDTSETPINRGFSMYPSRHRQLAKDLHYLEDRHPWEIIDDALEEYVIKHYGKEYRRK
jgi:hypothetical protein